MFKEPQNPLQAGYEFFQLVKQAHPDFERIVKKSSGIHPFDIEDTFDNQLFEDKVRQHGYFHSLEQKVHTPEQILDPNDITPGIVLFALHLGDVVGAVEVESLPYEDENGHLIIDCDGMFDTGRRERLSLESLGVIADHRGYWNTWNWLEPLPDDERVQKAYVDFKKNTG